jgi:hypothetical protein
MPADPRVGPSQHSPDGRWWFDGSTWHPALSANGRWHWTGNNWVPTTDQQRRPIPRTWWLFGPAWLVLLGAWAFFLIIASGGSSDLPQWAETPAVILIGAAVVATVGWGLVLGRNRARQLIVLSVPAGTAVLTFCYIIAMVTSNDPGADTAAAIGLSLIWIPALLVIALLLSVGGVCGALLRRRNHLHASAQD